MKSGVTQVIYLGGFGDESRESLITPSQQTRGRKILMDSVPTTALRAGIVIGEGSASGGDPPPVGRQAPGHDHPTLGRNEDTADRTERCAVQSDGFARSTGHGGPVLRDRRTGTSHLSTHDDDCRSTHGLSEGDHPGRELLSPRLSSHWLRFITDVDLMTARTLVDSMCNEVIVHDHRINDLFSQCRWALRTPPPRRFSPQRTRDPGGTDATLRGTGQVPDTPTGSTRPVGDPSRWPSPWWSGPFCWRPRCAPLRVRRPFSSSVSWSPAPGSQDR